MSDTIVVKFDMQDQHHRAALIRAILTIKGFTFRALAQRLRVSESVVSDVVHSRRNNRVVRDAIAEAIGQPAACIWPVRRREVSMT